MYITKMSLKEKFIDKENTILKLSKCKNVGKPKNKNIFSQSRKLTNSFLLGTFLLGI